MARTAQQQLFAHAVRECHRDTNSLTSYGKCMSDIMQSAKLSTAAGRRKRKAKAKKKR